MTRTILLTGTPAIEPERHLLRAGLLSATLDAGGLRWIRWGQVEVLRAIMFLVRTPGWGTPAAHIHDLETDEDSDRFEIRYKADYGEPGAGLRVSVRIAGEASGLLRAEAVIKAETPFETNRTGFVVLHPLDGFAGTEITVEHATGGTRALTMPLAISPGQPVMDIRALTHRPVPGLEVETGFEGDVFEMEDQRNWSDASFKTYNRPIGLPYPYLLSADASQSQSVVMTLRDSGAGDRPARAVVPPAITQQRLPAQALPLDDLAAVDAALAHADRLQALNLRWLLLRLDPAKDAAAGPDKADFTPLARLADATGAGVELQIILSAADDAGAEAEIGAIATRLTAAGIEPARVSAFAKVDEQSFQPGETRPPHPSEPALAAALVRHFPEAQPIGGTPAFFTEFNRKRPDPALWRGLTFATTPVVHAADDASVIETLQTLPHILSSAKALAGGLPLSVGPTGIGARLNPYGPAPTDNAPDAREGMAARDPRQRGLMAAAWIVGYLVRIAPYAPERFAFGAPTGPFGLLSTPQPYARELWDVLPAGTPYPLYHVAHWLGAAAGAPLLTAETEGGLAQLSWRGASGSETLLANLTPGPLALPAGLEGRATLLDAAALDDGSGAPRALPEGALPAQIDAYAILHLTGGPK